MISWRQTKHLSQSIVLKSGFWGGLRSPKYIVRATDIRKKHICLKRISLEKHIFNEMLSFNSKEDNPKLMWLISWMVQFLPYSIGKLRFFHFKGKFNFIYASFKDCPIHWTPLQIVSFHKVDFIGLMLGIWIPKISTANQSFRWKLHLTYFCLKCFIKFWFFAKRMIALGLVN